MLKLKLSLNLFSNIVYIIICSFIFLNLTLVLSSVVITETEDTVVEFSTFYIIVLEEDDIWD